MSSSSEEAKKEQRLKLLDDHIGRSLAESEKSGELRAAKSFGKPLDFGDGYDETPAELRMGYKVLKDAGVVPPEVELMQQIAALRAEIDTAPDAAPDAAKQKKLVEMQQALSLRLEKLGGSRTF
jgi:uncharacterized small protein (DUF1192 family)